METIQKQVKKQIGEWVAEDFRTAAVFSKYKIDFCCNGNRSITEACAKKAINSDALLLELEQVTNTTRNETIDYKSWPLDLLIDYIEKKHHRYVSEKIPVLKQFLNKLCKVHGERHPELVTINELFTASAGELTQSERRIDSFSVCKKISES